MMNPAQQQPSYSPPLVANPPQEPSCWAELLEADRRFFEGVRAELAELSPQIGRGTIIDYIHAALSEALKVGESAATQMQHGFANIQRILYTGQPGHDFEMLYQFPRDRWHYVLYIVGCAIYVGKNPKCAFWAELKRQQEALLHKIAEMLKDPSKHTSTFEGLWQLCSYICLLAHHASAKAEEESGITKILIPAGAFALGYMMANQ